MNEDRAFFAAWIAVGLKETGKTQRGLAQALGVDPATINRVLKGKRRLRVDEIEPAARYLGIAPPRGYSFERSPASHDYIDLPAELRSVVLARAMDLGIAPEEFLARAVRAAFTLLGPRRGGDREGVV